MSDEAAIASLRLGRLSTTLHDIPCAVEDVVVVGGEALLGLDGVDTPEDDKEVRPELTSREASTACFSRNDSGTTKDGTRCGQAS